MSPAVAGYRRARSVDREEDPWLGHWIATVAIIWRRRTTSSCSSGPASTWMTCTRRCRPPMTRCVGSWRRRPTTRRLLRGLASAAACPPPGSRRDRDARPIDGRAGNHRLGGVLLVGVGGSQRDLEREPSIAPGP